MRIFDFYTEWDYGRDAYLIIGQFRKLNLFEAAFYSSSDWDWEPNIRFGISIFNGSVFSLNFHISSISLDIDFLNYRCPMNLSYYRGA